MDYIRPKNRKRNRLTGFKLVTISYTEQASLVVKAETDEEAQEAILKTFEYIPGLTIISIEDAPDEVVKEAMSKQEASTDHTLN